MKASEHTDPGTIISVKDVIQMRDITSPGNETEVVPSGLKDDKSDISRVPVPLFPTKPKLSQPPKLSSGLFSKFSPAG